MLPFTESIQDNIRIRTFNANIDPDDLYWHKDKMDRLIKVKKGDGWELQVENQIPMKLIPEKIYSIPKETHHRLIKGSGDLTILIKEL